jgi:hypothetical protein
MSPVKRTEKMVTPPSELEVALTIRRIDRSVEIWKQFWKSVCFIGIAGFGYLSIDALAGKTTLASLLVHFFETTSGSGVSKWWMWGALICFIWAWLERNLRLRKVRSMSQRLEVLEKEIDKGRTSSGLTRAGETPAPGNLRGE